MTHTKNVKDVMVREDGAAMGPDVCFVQDVISKTGKQAIIDWDIKCGHRTPDGILYADSATGQLGYVKKGNGDWIKK